MSRMPDLFKKFVLRSLLLLAVVTMQGRWAHIAAAMQNRRIVVTLSISTLLIATNWLTFQVGR